MSRTPSKSPKGSPKTRRTYTRRSPRTKLHNALDELRDLIDRHCGAPAPMEKSMKTIVQQQKAALQTSNQGYQPLLSSTPVPNAYSTFTNQPQISPLAVQGTFNSFSNFNEPMIQQPIVEQPKQVADKVTCSGGPKEYNDFVTKFQQEYLQKTGNKIGRRAAQTLIKETGAWKAECIRTGKATVTGTARKGKEGKPVDLNVAKQILGNSSGMVQQAMTPKTEANAYINNLFGPAAPKKTRGPYKTKKAKQANNFNPFANTATNQKPKSRATRKYTKEKNKNKKVTVFAPGNLQPVTPGTKSVTQVTKPNPFNTYKEPAATTNKVNNFNPFGNTGTTQKPNSFNSFGFNQPQSTVGRINALQNKNTNSTSTTSSNTYEYEGEPMANGTRIIKIAGEKYFLEPQDKGLYEIDGDDYGDLVGYFDPDANGYISNSPQ
jgi:hypothetical protein